MKHLILVSLSLLLGFSVYSQSKRKLSPQAGGNGKNKSIDVPRGFVSISNNNYTFIKDSLNHLMAVSHGYDDTRLECINCQILQEESTLDYLVYTPNSGECKITIFGMNTTTKREVCLGQYTFQVADSVYHDIYLDGILSGNSITSKIKIIECKNRAYWNGEEGDMEVITWRIIHGNNEIYGVGNEITKEARKLIGDIPSGEAIIVTVTAKNNFQKPFITKGVFLKRD